jgi:hypothetical protein
VLDSPEGVCAGQAGSEYPATSVPFSICEVHDHHKSGAAYGYTRQLGYYPLLARSDTGEVLHARQRTGRASSGRGVEQFVNETAGRVRGDGAGRPPTGAALDSAQLVRVGVQTSGRLIRAESPADRHLD